MNLLGSSRDLLQMLAMRRRRAEAIPADPTQLRAPPKARDKVLESETHVWIHSIPSSLHPKQLCRSHPHLANRLAACWGDATRVAAFMDDVLIDKRGNRKGVSERVRNELVRLKRHHDKCARSSWWPWRLGPQRPRHAADYPILRRKTP